MPKPRDNLARIQAFHATNPGAYDKLSLTFNDGSSVKCHHLAADLIVKLHNALNDENKVKVSEKLNESKLQFLRLVDFALRNSTFRVS